MQPFHISFVYGSAEMFCWSGLGSLMYHQLADHPAWVAGLGWPSTEVTQLNSIQSPASQQASLGLCCRWWQSSKREIRNLYVCFEFLLASSLLLSHHPNKCHGQADCQWPWIEQGTPKPWPAAQWIHTMERNHFPENVSLMILDQSENSDIFLSSV